jgi:hypothetical protein
LLAMMLIEALLTWRFHWGAGLAAALVIGAALWPMGGPWLATFAAAVAGTATAMKLGGRTMRLPGR